ncbi:MAG: stage II sporulation protein M [Nanoarchaeota archaeon]
MVFEQFLEVDRVKRHVLSIAGLGVLYVGVSFLVAAYFFGRDVSVAMLFSITILLLPSAHALVASEEKIERRTGTRHFLRNHKDIFRTYLLLFVGILVAYIALGLVFGDGIFTYQLGFLGARGDITGDIAANARGHVPTPGSVLGVATQNAIVIIIGFVLSLFFGAGALFLITLNASVFAAFVVHVSRQVANPAGIIGLFLIHTIPEMAGFLVASIAGGVVSRAIMKERLGSDKFRNVMKDALVLLAIAVGIIIIAAVLEQYGTAPLVKYVV